MILEKAKAARMTAAAKADKYFTEHKVPAPHLESRVGYLDALIELIPHICGKDPRVDVKVRSMIIQ